MHCQTITCFCMVLSVFMVCDLCAIQEDHLCKDSGQDELTKGWEEEEAPVETKDVDHLVWKIILSSSTIVMMFPQSASNKQCLMYMCYSYYRHASLKPSPKPASKSSPCCAHTWQTGNWSRGKPEHTSEKIWMRTEMLWTYTVAPSDLAQSFVSSCAGSS